MKPTTTYTAPKNPPIVVAKPHGLYMMVLHDLSHVQVTGILYRINGQGVAAPDILRRVVEAFRTDGNNEEQLSLAIEAAEAILP